MVDATARYRFRGAGSVGQPVHVAGGKVYTGVRVPPTHRGACARPIFNRMTVPLDDAVFRETLAIAVDAVICVDQSQRIVFFNDGAATIFGYTPAEMLGQPIDRLLPSRFRQAHAGQMRKFGTSPESARRMNERGGITGVRKDGTEFPAEAAIAHIETSKGRVFSVVLRDVTDRRQFEAVNARLVRDLTRAVSARDDMMGIVSHDLRNPVNAVKMLAGAILQSADVAPLPESVTQHASVMMQAAVQMDRLIQDLLDVTGLESGRIQLTPQPVAAVDLVSAAVKTLAPLAAERGVELKVEVAPKLPRVDVDPDRVAQVFSNLIGNAIKYTGRGGSVTVIATAESDDVQVTIADTGIGIAKSELPRIFDRFWQSKRTNRSGAGLGLSIARGIVRAQGGRIWVESRAGEGTQVHFTLPRASQQRPAP